MKVYIVTSGCYSDYRIIAPFLDPDEAERFRNQYRYDDVEVFDTLDHDIDKGIMFTVYYRDWLIDDLYYVKDCVLPEECDSNVFKKQMVPYLNGTLYAVCLRAKDRATALKIAHERIGAILAMGGVLKDGCYTFPDYKKYKGARI